MPAARRASSRTSGARRSSCSSASRNAPTSARRPSRRSPKRSGSSAPRGRVQGVFVTSTPSAIRPNSSSQLRAGVQSEIRRLLRRCGRQTEARRQGVQGRLPQGARQRTGQLYVDHSAGMFVFDPQGRLRLFVSHGQERRRARARPAGAAADAGVSDAQARAREAAGRLGAALERAPHDARLRHEHAQALKAAGRRQRRDPHARGRRFAGADGGRALACARRRY